MDIDAILAIQMSVDNYWESGAVDDVDCKKKPSANALRIVRAQSSAAKLDFSMGRSSVILRKFIKDGAITPDGEILIDWLEAGPSSGGCFCLLPEKRIAELPVEISSVYYVSDPEFYMMLRELLVLYRTHHTGYQALWHLEQIGRRSSAQPQILSKQDVMMVSIDEHHWKKRLLSFARKPVLTPVLANVDEVLSAPSGNLDGAGSAHAEWSNDVDMVHTSLPREA